MRLHVRVKEKKNGFQGGGQFEKRGFVKGSPVGKNKSIGTRVEAREETREGCRERAEMSY